MGHSVYIVTRYKRSGGLGAVIRDADPRCFTMVMATGIVSVALGLAGSPATAMFGMFFCLTLFAQTVLGYSVHPKVRLGQAHSCVLVLFGVRLDGTRELIALAEGSRESTESWADLLRDRRRHGMRDLELVVGDGAMKLFE